MRSFRGKALLRIGVSTGLQCLFVTACSPIDPTSDAPTEEVDCGTPGEVDRIGETSLPTLEGCTVHRGSGLKITAYGAKDLEPLGSLRRVDGALWLDSCSELTSLHGLEKLEKAEWLEIDNAHSLFSLSDLRSLSSVKNVIIYRSWGLESLIGLQRVQSLERLSLSQHPKLKTLDGLQGLREVGSLDIVGNATLQSLKALSNLRTVGPGGLYIRNNPQLPQSEIDALLSRIEVQGKVVIEGNGP